MIEKICKNCGECYDQRTFEIQRFYCVLDAREVEPHDDGCVFFREKREV